MSIDYQRPKAERHGTEDFIKPAEKYHFSGTDRASQTAQAYLLIALSHSPPYPKTPPPPAPANPQPPPPPPATTTTTFLFDLPTCVVFTQIGLIRPSFSAVSHFLSVLLPTKSKKTSDSSAFPRIYVQCYNNNSNNNQHHHHRANYHVLIDALSAYMIHIN